MAGRGRPCIQSPVWSTKPHCAPWGNVRNAAAPPLPASPGYLGEADLHALPKTLGPLTALVPPAVPAEFSLASPGASALPAEAFYFLDGGGGHGGDADPALDRAKLAQRGLPAN